MTKLIASSPTLEGILKMAAAYKCGLTEDSIKDARRSVKEYQENCRDLIQIFIKKVRVKK